jgi:RNA processing factor Prp31
MFRGIRVHFTTYLKNEDFNENDLEKASLGLAHAFSRSRVGQDLNRQDKHII